MSIDKDLFRTLAGSFATGVTVITSSVDGQHHAMTASAFSSLSLEPPMVLVCVDRRAATLGYVQRSGRFNVNILRHEQQTLSNACARKETPESRLEGVEFWPGLCGVPVLSDSLAYLQCQVRNEFDGGDHVIFTGVVEDGAIDGIGSPLLYFRGSYVASALEPH